MFKNLVRLYSTIVCLICSIALLVTISLTLTNIFRIVLVEYKYSSTLERYADNERFLSYYHSKAQEKYSNAEPGYGNNTSAADSIKRVSSLIAGVKNHEKITDIRLAEKADHIARIKHENIISIIDYLGWMVASALFLVIHVYIYKKSRKVEE